MVTLACTCSSWWSQLVRCYCCWWTLNKWGTVTVVHTASLIVPIRSSTIWCFSSFQFFSSYLEVFLFDIKVWTPSVFFFFLVLQSLSGSLQRISKETFSSTSNECFSTCTGLPNCEYADRISWHLWVMGYYIPCQLSWVGFHHSELGGNESSARPLPLVMLKIWLDCILGWRSSLRHVKCTFLSS